MVGSCFVPQTVLSCPFYGVPPNRWSTPCVSGSTRSRQLPARGPTAEAIRYGLNHWDGLQRFLEDGRIEIDSNSTERAMRPVSLSRKNSLFAGSDEGGENWACLASLIETCKLMRSIRRHISPIY